LTKRIHRVGDIVVPLGVCGVNAEWSAAKQVNNGGGHRNEGQSPMATKAIGWIELKGRSARSNKRLMMTAGGVERT